MRCATCSLPLADESSSCPNCDPTPGRCASCGETNRADARFCNGCGAPIHQDSTSGDRRQITVMFCDVVDSTPLSERLDPEDFRDVIRRLQALAADAIEPVGGRIAQYLGDGLLAYFGHPVASEDDAGRALRASLAILEALPDFNAELASLLDEPLRIRIGVHSGMVVVAPIGGGEKRETLALGETVHIAARLMGHAEPDSLLTSEATRQLLGPEFLLESVGPKQLKGVSEPIHGYRVSGLEEGQWRSPSTAPLIGRDRDMELLSSHVESLRTGRGRAVLLCGEPGIGKTRLVESVTEDLDASGDTWLSCRCSPYHTASPFHPVIGAVEQTINRHPDDAPEQIRERLAELMRGARLPTNESVELLAELLGLPKREAVASRMTRTVEARRRETFDVLRAWARAAAHRQPTVLIFEDVHWADPSTLELINGLIAECRTAPLLLIVTFRPSFEPSWESPVIHRHTIEPLARWQVSSLIDALLNDRDIDSRTREKLIARTDGVPLFVEEVTHAFLASGGMEDAPESAPEIPTSLRGLLAARIDRLSGSAAETLHLASAMGREFRFDVLSFAASPERSEPDLRRDLTSLRRAGIVVREPDTNTEIYAFRHALIQEAARDSMIRENRRSCHRRIGTALRDHFPSVESEQPELLAHHFAEARELGTAIGYWKKAGERALARGAHQEAATHFDRGLELVEQLSVGRDRLHTEVELIEAKGTALFSALGYSHPLVESTFERAERACDELGEEAPLRVLYGLWGVHLTRANTQALERLLPRLQAWAKLGDPISRLTATAGEAIRAFYLGQFDVAQRCAEQAIDCVRTPEHDQFVEHTGYVGGLYPFGYLSWTLGIRGDLARALTVRDEMREIAEQLENPYGVAVSESYAMNLARDTGDVEVAARISEEQIAFTTSQELPFWQGSARCVNGWAAIHSGDPESGIKEIERGRAILEAVGLRVTYSYYCAPIVDGLIAVGRPADGLQEVRRLKAMDRSLLSGFYAAELQRLEAACLQGEEAEQCGERSLALAAAQGAHSWTLHAATDQAARLASRDSGAASRLLDGALSHFGAELDVPSLSAARALRSRL